MAIIAGLDVGGAHLKVALVDRGRVIAAEQYVCPLWQGLDKLETALAEASALLGQAERHAVTMTGELSDLFADRKAGVETLCAKLTAVLGPQTKYWMGRLGFGTAAEAVVNHRDVGSTNFLATAAVVASRQPDALLIDFGSTTADIIPIRGGKPVPRGLTDGDRQVTGELIYTGLTRTAVVAVTDRAPFRGHWVGLAREYLATMADVRRILGELPEDVDLHATADGKGKSYAESVARFARLLGRDASEAAAEEWRTAAAYVREMQLRSIFDGVLQVLSASALPLQAPIVLAGIGADSASITALRLGRSPLTFGSLIDAAPDQRHKATRSAPAVAVALLAR